MKTGVKILLAIISVIVVVLISAFIYNQVQIHQRNAMYDDYTQCVIDCDIEGAREYSEKLNLGDSGSEELDVVEKFLSYHDTGEYQIALDEFEHLKSWGASRYGKLQCTYKDCIFETQIKQQAQDMMAAQDYAMTVVLLTDFAMELQTCEKQSEYGKYFPENGKLYFDIVEETGKALFESNDNVLLRQFLDGIHWQEPDENFGSHSWAEAAVEWWHSNMT